MLTTAGVAYAVVPTLSQTNITVGLGQSLSVTSENGTGDLHGIRILIPGGLSFDQRDADRGHGRGARYSSGRALCGRYGFGLREFERHGDRRASHGDHIQSSKSRSLSAGSNQSATVSGGNGTYTFQQFQRECRFRKSFWQFAHGAERCGRQCDGHGMRYVQHLRHAFGHDHAGSTSALRLARTIFPWRRGKQTGDRISGGTGSYSISSISNPSTSPRACRARGGMWLRSSSGTATITVCDTSNVCGTLTVTVTGSPSGTSRSCLILRIRR